MGTILGIILGYRHGELFRKHDFSILKFSLIDKIF